MLKKYTQKIRLDVVKETLFDFVMVALVMFSIGWAFYSVYHYLEYAPK